MEDLIQLAWKAGFAASILMLVVMCGQRAGPLLASIAMTYPFNVGVGFTLMVLNRSDEFMAAAGLSGFALAGGVFAGLAGPTISTYSVDLLGTVTVDGRDAFARADRFSGRSGTGRRFVAG